MMWSDDRYYLLSYFEKHNKLHLITMIGLNVVDGYKRTF